MSSDGPKEWQFFYSEKLGMKYAVKGQRLHTEDGVEYSRKEANIVKDEIGEIDKTTHLFKKFFEGAIADVKGEAK